MGYLQERFGLMMIGKTPEGTCPMCGIKHAPEQPHNKDSFTYQYKFYDEYGRWPTWKDAMKHCPEEIKSVWENELTKRGIQV